MRSLFFIVVLFFGATLLGQNSPLSTKEFNRLADFEGSQVAFGYDDLLSNYRYTTQTLEQTSTYAMHAQVKVRSFLNLNLVDDTYCFSTIYFGFNLYRQGNAYDYDSVSIAIGFASNIKKGDAIFYHFAVKSDANGDAMIGGVLVEEILAKSMEMKRPLTFYFYNKKELTGEFMIAYAKVGQKFGGIIKTRNNLVKKYVLCED